MHDTDSINTNYLGKALCGSQILFLLYVAFLHKSAEYGFGQDINTLSIEDAVNAVKIEMIGQTFGVPGMAVAKWSLGLFLLRIVVKSDFHSIATRFTTSLTHYRLAKGCHLVHTDQSHYYFNHDGHVALDSVPASILDMGPTCGWEVHHQDNAVLSSTGWYVLPRAHRVKL